MSAWARSRLGARPRSTIRRSSRVRRGRPSGMASMRPLDDEAREVGEPRGPRAERAQRRDRGAGGALGAALRGLDTEERREGRLAVARVLADRLPEPLRAPLEIEHVVDDLEREPDAGPVLAQRVHLVRAAAAEQPA